MNNKKISMEDYRSWCSEQMTKPGHPIGCDNIPSGATEDYLIMMHGLWSNGERNFVYDGFQEKWQWLIDNCAIGPRGLMIVPRELPFYSDDIEHDLWWKLNCRLYTKYLGSDGIIYHIPTWKHGHDVDTLIFSYIELMERELESLGFVYDDDGNYGKEPGKIDPNLCYVNMNGERRRLSDAPSYGC